MRLGIAAHPEGAHDVPRFPRLSPVTLWHLQHPEQRRPCRRRPIHLRPAPVNDRSRTDDARHDKTPPENIQHTTQHGGVPFVVKLLQYQLSDQQCMLQVRFRWSGYIGSVSY